MSFTNSLYVNYNGTEISIENYIEQIKTHNPIIKNVKLISLKNLDVMSHNSLQQIIVIKSQHQLCESLTKTRIKIVISNIYSSPFWYEKNNTSIRLFCKKTNNPNFEIYSLKYCRCKSDYQLVYSIINQSWTSEQIFKTSKNKKYQVKDNNIISTYNELRNVIMILEFQRLYSVLFLTMKNRVPMDVFNYTIKLYYDTFMVNLS